MTPAAKPMIMAAQVLTKAQPPVMATSPANAPLPGRGKRTAGWRDPSNKKTAGWFKIHQEVRVPSGSSLTAESQPARVPTFTRLGNQAYCCAGNESDKPTPATQAHRR